MSEVRTYLTIPFEYKDESRELGCRWDANMKRWYIPESASNKEEIKKWCASLKTFLNIPFEEKDFAKQEFKVRYDPDMKKWYVLSGEEDDIPPRWF
jgi:hypothetical protein